MTTLESWPDSKRWQATLVACFFTLITTLTATGYPLCDEAITSAFDVSHTTFVLGNTMYLLAIALVPLVLAPLSEDFGRRPVYIATTLVYAVCFIPQALADNMATIVATRFFCGAAGSIGNSLAAGVISDCFAPAYRGLPLYVYSTSVYIGQGIGPVAYVATATLQGWRIAFWWNGAAALVAFVAVVALFPETRPPAVVPPSEKRPKVARAATSTTVALTMLLTQPVIGSISLWSALLWGINYMAFGAIPLTFAQAYGWSLLQQSFVFLTMLVAALAGYVCHVHQEQIQASDPERIELRLRYACVGALLAPAGLFIFAWTARASITPVAPVIGVLLFNTAIFPIYQAIFSYLSEVYGHRSSSAVAAQSFLRNLFAAVLPLLNRHMYENLGSPLATTTLAALATVFSAVPFVIVRYGPVLRRKTIQK